MTNEMTSELDTSQFNNTPIIRKLKSHSQPKVREEEEQQQEEEQRQEEEEVKPKSN